MSLKSDAFEREGSKDERRGDWSACGRNMLAAAETMPDHSRHAERLVKAAQCFQKGRLVGQAIKARLEMISAHPKDPLARDALFDVAVAYHQTAYYSKAADCYEAFATAFPSDKRAAKARANAKEFSAALGSDADADNCVSGRAVASDRRHQEAGQRKETR